MMKHFNFKSLAFYGVAIGSVLILFKVVTAYGETNLKAPVPISGSYRIKLAQNLPNCPKLSELILDIQQSGIYLNGSLLPANVNAQQARSGEKSPSLTGNISNQQLTLAGTVPKSIICNNQPQLSIQSLLQGNNLVGKLILNTSQEFKFTAQRLAPVSENQSSTSH